MKTFRIPLVLILVTLLLVACQSAPAGTSPDATTAPTDAAYPQPNPAANEAYPQPGASNELTAMDGVYPVLPGDEDRVAGGFFINTAELRANPNNAAQTDVFVTGSLPTPCNEIRAKVTPPEAGNQITVQVYSVADKDKICTQNLAPYEGVVATLTDIPAGTYAVIVNNTYVGEVTVQ